MDRRLQDESQYYWGVDLPGMTREQASQIASVVSASGMDITPLTIDPSVFLTLHVDRATAEILQAGLNSIEPNAIVGGVKESISDWLDWTASFGNAESQEAGA